VTREPRWSGTLPLPSPPPNTITSIHRSSRSSPNSGTGRRRSTPPLTGHCTPPAETPGGANASAGRRIARTFRRSSPSNAVYRTGAPARPEPVPAKTPRRGSPSRTPRSVAVPGNPTFSEPCAMDGVPQGPPGYVPGTRTTIGRPPRQPPESLSKYRPSGKVSLPAQQRRQPWSSPGAALSGARAASSRGLSAAAEQRGQDPSARLMHLGPRPEPSSPWSP
jgi:hypothetical protein